MLSPLLKDMWVKQAWHFTTIHIKVLPLVTWIQPNYTASKRQLIFFLMLTDSFICLTLNNDVPSWEVFVIAFQVGCPLRKCLVSGEFLIILFGLLLLAKGTICLELIVKSKIYPPEYREIKSISQDRIFITGVYHSSFIYKAVNSSFILPPVP